MEKYGDETNKCIEMFNHSMPATGFGHCCGLPKGGALQMIHYKNFVNQRTNIRY
jgi:hypothetical protein